MVNDREFRIKADSKGKSLSGEKFYMLRLLTLIPGCNFWSLIIYDSQTQLIIHTDQSWPSVYSTQKVLEVNPDGSVDIFFGPVNTNVMKCNFLKTIPGKEWFVILRLYDLAEPVNSEWKPEEIREVDNDSEQKKSLVEKK